MNLISGLFMHLDDAKRAVSGLTQLGIATQHIQLIFDEHQDHKCHDFHLLHGLMNTQESAELAKSELASTLQVQGMPQDEAALYAEAVMLGGALVTVQLTANQEDLVADTLAYSRAINLDCEQAMFATI